MTIWPRFEPNNDLEARPLELMGSREKGHTRSGQRQDGEVPCQDATMYLTKHEQRS
jgi:hypothetical protein